MQPNNTPPAPPPAPLPSSSPGEYDFILKTNTQPKRGLGPNLSGTSSTQRLIIVIAIGLVLIMFFIILFAVIFKGDDSTSTQLTDLAQQQNEIARVADIGVNKAVSPATKNFAHTTK